MKSKLFVAALLVTMCVCFGVAAAGRFASGNIVAGILDIVLFLLGAVALTLVLKS